MPRRWVFALGVASIVALAGGCFIDIAEVRELEASGGASASATATGGPTTAGTGGASGGSAPTGPCNDGSGDGCPWSCPAGTSCVDGCCRIEALPTLCSEAIDVTGEARRFYWDGCGKPPTYGESCATVRSDAALLLRAGASDFGYGYQIQLTSDAYWLVPTCGSPSFQCTSPTTRGGVSYVVLADDDSAALVPVNPCEPVIFDVCTKLSQTAICQL